MAHGNRYDPRQGSLGRRLQWADEPVEPRPAGGFCRDEHTRNRTESPVERELANRRVLGESFGRDLARRRKHGERDRKIEPGAFLAKIAGARLTVIRRSGHSSSALPIPLLTRSFASWQALSGKPTITNAGTPR